MGRILGTSYRSIRSAPRCIRRRPVLLCLVPILGHALIFSVAPIVVSFYLSFFEYTLLSQRHFVGLQNYMYAVTRDAVFHRSLINTTYFALISVVLGMLLSLIMAQLIHTAPRLKTLFRTAYFLPVVTPLIATAVVWRFILQPSTYGLLNGLLVALELRPQAWLTSGQLVIPSLIVVAVWSSMGYNIILFLAGLAGIPEDFYEAARLDGANAWHLFKNITWPLLAPTVLLVTVTGTIGSLQVFALPYVLTRGG